MLRRRFLLGSTALVGVAALRQATAATVATAPVPPAPGLVTILHANDVYEITPKEGQGGFAPFMTLLRQERARPAATVTTFGGDLLSPSILSGLTKGQQMIELMNALGIDIAVLGNHEFDFGPELCAERVGQSSFPWLGSNVLDAQAQPAVGTVASRIVEVGGFRLGFLGLLTPDTAHLSSPGPAISFADPIPTAERLAADLRQQGAELVVALTHLDLAEDRELLRAVPGVDIVLGGHDHEPITFYEGGQLILKAGYDFHFLVALDLQLERVEKDGKTSVRWEPLAWRYLATAEAEPDAQIAAMVATWEARLSSELDVVVGRTAVALDSRRASVRTRETNMGDLIADAIKDATGADVALTNGGGIRGDRLYEAGTELTRKDILGELPFGNTTVLLEVDGATLKAALENGVSQVQDMAGRFPQIAGMRFTYDPARPAGQRVTEVTVGGQPLDPARTYRLATNNYLLSGGDGYAVLKGAKAIIDPSAAVLMASTVMGYVARLGTVTIEPDGRIRAVE